MEWIKCKDQLPPLEKHILLCAQSGYIGCFEPDEIYYSIDRLNLCHGDKEPNFNCNRFYEAIALAWMEIPEFKDE